MSYQCLSPFVAVKRFEKLNGKVDLKLYSKSRLDYDLNSLKFKFGSDNVFLLPCGKCESCKSNKAKEWAIRCELEAKEHKYNYFITLTYDDFHLAKASKKDLDDFLDRLEGRGHKNTFKYLAAQELGELTERLHYHLVLFCDFEIDLIEPVKLGGFYHFHSKLLGNTWKFGLHDISPFQFNCARYVAKYTMKDSKLYMSRNIGKTYFLKHYEEIVKDNFRVYSDFGGKYSSYVPQAFIRWFEEINPELVLEHKSFKKKLAHYVQSEKKRALIVEHDEDSIKYEQNELKKKGKKKRL